MAQIEKMEVQVEMRSSAEKCYEVLRSKHYLYPTICPELFKQIKLIKGDWESVGSIREWIYVAGNTETSKDMIEAIDDENKAITMTIIDGDVTKYYKTIKATSQVTEKDDGGCSVKWTVEYEKINDSVPAPVKYLELMPIITKSIDTYISKNA